MLVIADLLGVPEDDHPRFVEALLHGQAGHGAVGSTSEGTLALSPLEYLYQQLTAYMKERRLHARDDVLTVWPRPPFPRLDPRGAPRGPRRPQPVRGGPGDHGRLLGSALQLIAQDAELQQILPKGATGSPTSSRRPSGWRVRSRAISGCRGPVTVGGVDLPAGTTVMLVNAAANRDPRRFQEGHIRHGS